MKQKKKKQTSNRILYLILLLGVVFLVVVLKFTASFSTEETMNYQSMAAGYEYALEVQDVRADHPIQVNVLKNSTPVYIEIYKKIVNGEREVIGQSNLIESGVHSNIALPMNSVSEGDVIYVILKNENNESVKDSYNQDVFVVKPVGQLMNHYENEF